MPWTPPSPSSSEKLHYPQHVSRDALKGRLQFTWVILSSGSHSFSCALHLTGRTLSFIHPLALPYEPWPAQLRLLITITTLDYDSQLIRHGFRRSDRAQPSPWGRHPATQSQPTANQRILHGKNSKSTTFILTSTLHFLPIIFVFVLMLALEIQALKGSRDSRKRPRTLKMPAYTHGLSKTSALSTAETSFPTATSPTESTESAT